MTRNKHPGQGHEPATIKKRFPFFKTGAALVIAACACFVISSPAFAKTNVNAKGSGDCVGIDTSTTSIRVNNALATFMESAINSAKLAAVNQTFTDETSVGQKSEGVENSTTCIVDTSSEATTDGSSAILTQTNSGQIERIINANVADVFTPKMMSRLMVMNESIPAQIWQEGSVVVKKIPDGSGIGVTMLTAANLKSGFSDFGFGSV